jgi:hypothetical protein
MKRNLIVAISSAYILLGLVKSKENGALMMFEQSEIEEHSFLETSSKSTLSTCGEGCCESLKPREQMTYTFY